MSLVKIEKQLKKMKQGDLISVEWYDASIGKTGRGRSGDIDILVKTCGIFLGILGRDRKHLIVAQNVFLFSDGEPEIDWTAVPLAWGTKITVIVPTFVTEAEAKKMLDCFLRGGGTARIMKTCGHMQRMRLHV